VVMVHHRDVQAAIATELDDLGVVRITGGQGTTTRQTAIDAFQDRQAQVAVCSIQTAGVGIALHAASQVVLGELPWTAAAQDQAIDRVHRIGQDRPVTAWRIIASGTLDERMAELIGEKAAIGLAAIDGGVVAAGSEELGALDALVDLVTAALAQPRKRKARKARTPKAAAA
jgi:SNF2 family DNA or RNA helicase